MFDTTKKKIFCFTSIIAYILTIVLSFESFSGLQLKTGKINVDGAEVIILLVALATVMFALWTYSWADLSQKDKRFTIAFAVALGGIACSGLSFWRFALLNEAGNVASLHSSSEVSYIGYSKAEQSSFYKLSSEFESSATLWLILTIVLWIITALSIFYIINNIKKSQ